MNSIESKIDRYKTAILKRYSKPHSIKYRLLVIFCLVSIVPMIIMNIISYINISDIVESNLKEYASTSLLQTHKSVQTIISSYEDLLYQLYTDDNIVELINKINENQDIAVSKNQLRRTLRGLVYVKPYITSITIIMDDGQMVFYDKLTASILKTSWMDNYKEPKSELYKNISASYSTKILSTEYASEYNSQRYYLFHMAHRIIDYRHIKKNIGVVILSIEEKMLDEVINQSYQKNGESNNGISLVVDNDGFLVSFTDDQFMGQEITSINNNKINEEEIKNFLRKNDILSGKYLDINSYYNEELKWHIINVSNQSILKEELNNQLKNTILFISISFIILFIIVIISTKQLTKSINHLVEVMRSIKNGKLDAKVNINQKMPVEIAVIAQNFNRMIEQIQTLINKVKDVTNKKKDAEIRALEAQINPHFLYNTLDTINWMAIDEEEYQISNAISSLAQILRYGINMSNKTVNLEDEIEWIKRYIFLQQTRLKSSFEFNLYVEPETLELKIHKLLFQPFIENALVHGYQEKEKKFRLNIRITIEDGMLKIIIDDNGKGIKPEDLEDINKMIDKKEGNSNHIGIMNAVERIHLYYGDDAKISIKSKVNKSTSICIYLPIV